MSFGRGYTIDELKQTRDDWYRRIEEKKNEDARHATNDLRAEEDEQKLSEGLQFRAYFRDSEINLGKSTNIIFYLFNNTDHNVEILNYRFEIYYLFINRLVPHISFSKHYWDLNPSELGPHESRDFSFGEVNPSKYYLLSDEKGKWMARIYLEYTYNQKFINSIFADATIRIM